MPKTAETFASELSGQALQTLGTFIPFQGKL